MTDAMTFPMIPYARPDFTELEDRFRRLVEGFAKAESAAAQIGIMKDLAALRNHIETLATLVSIRHSLDTRDAFYDGENLFMDEAMPRYEGLLSEFYHALHASAFRDDLSDAFGRHLFDLVDVKTFRPEVLEDLQSENKLCSEYVKLLASARIPFEGEERNLSQMGPFSQSKDRGMRMRAQKAVTAFFAEHEAEFDRIYDELVRIRTTIAKKLGFKSFIELGYARMNRTDYDADGVKCYRAQVLESVVPVTQRLRERQAARLQLDALKHYDESLTFLSGNAAPKGSPEWMTEHARHMYSEMSAETGIFFHFMLDHDLLDLVAKPGKAGGGYCTFIADEKAPFIFSNFNGTSDDVDVLTHEAGHAFAAYESRNAELPEYLWPTLEACEIHSMSMEFLAWPWMDRFFQEDAGKYKFAHLSGSLLFIPYGTTVDEFQHWVYENPDASPESRKSKWRETEMKYLPHRDYDDNEFLERGGYWFRQGHIFTSPFYYIDYTLAQVSAFEFWERSELDRSKAWTDYLSLCRAGGSRPYLDLLELAGLRNPFEDGSVAAVMGPVVAWLDKTDDMNM